MVFYLVMLRDSSQSSNLQPSQVFVGDALKCEEDEWVKANVFQVSSIPYPWLLPRCSIPARKMFAQDVSSAIVAGCSLAHA